MQRLIGWSFQWEKDSWAKILNQVKNFTIKEEQRMLHERQPSKSDIMAHHILISPRVLFFFLIDTFDPM